MAEKDSAQPVKQENAVAAERRVDDVLRQMLNSPQKKKGGTCRQTSRTLVKP